MLSPDERVRFGSLNFFQQLVSHSVFSGIIGKKDSDCYR